MRVKKLNRKLRQALACLVSFRDKGSAYVSLFPVIALLFTIFIFVVEMGFRTYVYNNNIKLTENQENLFLISDWVIKHIGDSSFIFIALMFFTSKNYRALSWICFIVLLNLWLLNIYYVCNNYLVDWYYVVYALLSSIVIIIICLYGLTKR